MWNKLTKVIELLFGIIIYLYEEIFLYFAKKCLKYIKNFKIYENIILYFSKNIYLNLIFLILTLFIAESFAIFAGYLFVKKYYIIGLLFYGFKILLFIPIVELFEKNKQNLLKYKIIKIPYYYFLKIKKLPIFYKLKKIKKKFKIYLFYLKKNFFKIFKNILKKD